MMTQPDRAGMLADDEARIEPRAEDRAVESGPHSNAAFDDHFLSTGDLASLIRVDPSTLRRWRNAKPPEGPPFTPLSAGVVLYSIVDVRRWIAQRRIDPAELA